MNTIDKFARSFSVLAPLSLIVAGCVSVPEDAGEAPEATGTSEDELYYASTKLWPSNLIPVCWDNATSGDATARGWVRDQIAKTWEQASGVQFTGWGSCASGSAGIHIRIADEHPRTLALGKNMNAMSGGMVLNFTYANWGTSCQSSLEFCTRAIAAHEFGHALGFAHEQNRPDTPSTCHDAPQGEDGDAIIGAWDLSSIMNYCNPSWNNGGALSATDTDAVRLLYGLRSYRPSFVLANYGYNAGTWRVEQHVRLLADVDGDGRKDIVGFGDAGTYVSTSTGSGFTAPLRWVVDYGYVVGGWRVDRHVRLLGDVNGDGKADVVGFGETGTYVSLSTGSRFTAPSLWVADYGYGSGWRVDQHPRFLADVNADGKADIVAFGDAGVYVSLSTGAGFTAPSLWVADYGYGSGWRAEQHPRLVADINADGRADIVGFGDAGTYVSVSTGTGFTAPSLWVADYGYSSGWRVDRHPRLLADVDADGRADIVGFGDAGTYVSVSTGTGFTAPSLWVADFGYSAGTWRVDQHQRFLADVNGDRRADVVGFGDSGMSVALSTGGAFVGPEFRVRNLGYSAGWRVTKNPILMGDVANDGRADAVGFGNDGVWIIAQ